MTTTHPLTEQQAAFATIRELLDGAVTITKDKHPVNGVTSWVEFAVNSESDLCYFITRNEDGSLSYLAGYGILLASTRPSPPHLLNTYNGFMYTISDDNGFSLNCPDWECENYGFDDCEQHPNVNAQKAWKLIQQHIFSEFS